MSSANAPQRGARIPELDGIRGVAIIAVLLTHVQQVLLPPALIGDGAIGKIIDRFFQIGWMGVDIFFVLSGFLITGIILKGAGESRFYRNFYVRRAARILPAFLVVFCAVVAFLPRLHGWVYAAYLLFVPNWLILTNFEVEPLAHIWSLGIEEQFYLFWPPVARTFRRDQLMWIALGVAALSILLRLILHEARVGPFVIYKVTLARLDGLCLGAALAAAVLTPIYKDFLFKAWKGIAWSAFIVWLLGFASMHGSYYATNIWSLLLGSTSLEILTCALIFGSIEQMTSRNLKVFLSNGYVGWAGRRSYFLYLVHPPLLYLAAYELKAHGRFHIVPALTTGLLIMAFSLLLSELSWRGLESTAIRLGHRLTQGSDAGAVQTLR